MGSRGQDAAHQWSNLSHGSDWKVRTQEAENFDEEVKSLVSAWPTSSSWLVLTSVSHWWARGSSRLQSFLTLLRVFFSGSGSRLQIRRKVNRFQEKRQRTREWKERLQPWTGPPSSWLEALARGWRRSTVVAREPAAFLPMWNRFSSLLLPCLLWPQRWFLYLLLWSRGEDIEARERKGRTLTACQPLPRFSPT